MEKDGSITQNMSKHKLENEDKSIKNKNKEVRDSYKEVAKKLEGFTEVGHMLGYYWALGAPRTETSTLFLPITNLTICYRCYLIFNPLTIAQWSNIN